MSIFDRSDRELSRAIDEHITGSAEWERRAMEEEEEAAAPPPPRKREPQGKPPRTYVEEIALKYIRRLKWTNDTLEADTKLFWMACYRLNKARPTMLRDMLEWAADNRLHPKQFVKAVNTKLSTWKRLSNG